MSSEVKGQLFMTSSEALEVVRVYICLGHLVAAGHSCENITRKINIGWSLFGRRRHTKKSSL